MEPKEYFDQVAAQWDELRSGYFNDQMRQSAISKAYLHPNMVVADIGAGTGSMAAGLAPLVQHVHLVDGSAAMLQVAQSSLSSFPNLSFHEADGLSLPFPDASLDAIFANMYLHHCPDPLAAVSEMVRVLKPGGRLVITDLDAHPHAWMKEEMADIWQGFERLQIREWLTTAGLVNIVVDCTGQNCCTESQSDSAREAELQASISVFVASGTRRVSGARQAVQAGYSARAEIGSCGCSSAAQPSSECCTPASITQDLIMAGDVQFYSGYSPSELAAAPQEAGELSLGCGNPTAMAGIKEGEVVLDIGSGAGLDAFLAARKVGATGRVIGVDMTPAMLERARNSAKKAGLHQVEFRQGYAESLPVEDSSIDVILSNCVINLCEDKGLVFQEAYRVLAPNGRLEISDIVFAGAVPSELRLQMDGWAECITGALPEAEYLDLIKQAGFTNLQVRRSQTYGEVDRIPIYGVLVSAQKP